MTMKAVHPWDMLPGLAHEIIQEQRDAGTVNMEKVALVSMLYAAFFLLIWALSCIALRVVFRSWDINGAPCSTWAMKFMKLSHHAVAAPLAWACLSVDATSRQVMLCLGCESLAEEFLRNAPGPWIASTAVIPLSLGYFVADLILVRTWDIESNNALLIELVHHTGCLVFWPLTIKYWFCERVVMMAIGTEVSSIFLTAIWMLSKAGLKASRLYMLTGFLFTVSFIVARWGVALIQLRAFYYFQPWTVYGNPKYQASYFTVKLSLSVLLPHLLNLFWGVKVLQGGLRILAGSKKKKQKCAKES